MAVVHTARKFNVSSDHAVGKILTPTVPEVRFTNLALIRQTPLASLYFSAGTTASLTGTTTYSEPDITTIISFNFPKKGHARMP